MTETESRDLLEAIQQTITESQEMIVVSSGKITKYIIEQKLKINELENEIVILKCEKNDWKQRANSAEECYETLAKTAEECLQKKVNLARKEVARDILQDMVNENWAGNVYFIERFARELAKKYGVEIKK